MSNQPTFKPKLHEGVVELYSEGWRQVEIAKRLGISQQRVSQILRRHRKLQERPA